MTGKSTTLPASKSMAPVPQTLPGLLSLESRLPLAPTRPKCNSILHLFGTWLFDAALANVKILPVHKNAGKRVHCLEVIILIIVFNLFMMKYV